MADISQEISAFLSAVYGEDVRGAIVDLANKLNDSVEGVTNGEFYYRGTIDSGDNISEGEYLLPGMWTYLSSSNFPTGWPTDCGSGRLITFGSTNQSYTNAKVQMIFERLNNGGSAAADHCAFWYRTADSYNFHPWKKVATDDFVSAELASGKYLMYKRELTSSDDLNADEFKLNSMWAYYGSSNFPANWPTDCGPGRLITFGSGNSSYLNAKVQMIFERLDNGGTAAANHSGFWYRTADSFVWHSWRKVVTNADADDMLYDLEQKLGSGTYLCWRRYLTSSDNITTDAEFQFSGMWNCGSENSKPVGWPDGCGTGRLVTYGITDENSSSETETSYAKAQVIFTRGAPGTVWFRTANQDGWHSWHKLFTDSGVLSSADDINGVYDPSKTYDDRRFKMPGTWYCANSSSIPAHWPSDVGPGRLVTFGSSGTSTDDTRTQMVFPNGSSEVWIRTSTSSGWNDWERVVTGNDGKYIGYRRQLTNADNIDSGEFLLSGMWYCTGSSNTPGTGWPTDCGPGRLITFGSGSSTYLNAKVQMIFERLNNGASATADHCAFWYRTSDSLLWHPWKRVSTGGMSGLPASYIAVGASTVGGWTKQGDDTVRSDHPYPWFVGKMGNFDTNNLALGGIGVYYRSKHSGDGHKNFMDIITDPENASALSKAEVITLMIGNNDREIALKDIDNTYTAADVGNDYDALIGNYNDYFLYDRNTHLNMSDTDFYALVTSASNRASICGCWNFCIKYLSENFPHAQLVAVMPVVGNRTNVASVNPVTNKVEWTPRDSSYYWGDGDDQRDQGKGIRADHPYNWRAALYMEKAIPKLTTLLENSNVPIANPNPAFVTSWTNLGSKYADAYYVHPKLSEYEQWSRPIAAAILAKFRN